MNMNCQTYPFADDIAIRMQYATENAFGTTILSVGFLINNFQKRREPPEGFERGEKSECFSDLSRWMALIKSQHQATKGNATKAERRKEARALLNAICISLIRPRSRRFYSFGLTKDSYISALKISLFYVI